MLNLEKIDDLVISLMKLYEYNFESKGLILGAQRHYFIKNTDEKRERISFNYVYQHGKFILSNMPTHNMEFFKVTNIFRILDIEKYFKNNYVNFSWYSSLWSTYSVPGNSRLLDEITKLILGENKRKFLQTGGSINEEVIHKDNLKIATGILRGYFVNKIFPEFDKVINLQHINDEIINKKTSDEISFYIPGPLRDFKILIIMKLCDNPAYTQHRKWMEKTLQESVKEDKEKNLPYYTFFKDLETYLETI